MRNNNETRITNAAVVVEKYDQTSRYSRKTCEDCFDASPHVDAYKFSSVYQCEKSNWIESSCQCRECNSNPTTLYWHPKVYKHYDNPTNEEIHYCDGCLRGKVEIFQITGNYCPSCWQQETHPDV